MPYRRFPKTDAARLRALKTLLSNNDIYMVRNRFIDWKVLNEAQSVYDRLLTDVEQYKLILQSQKRFNAKLVKYQHNATLYITHFLRVLLMCVERGEIKREMLRLYGLEPADTSVPMLTTYERVIQWGQKTIEGEKARIKKGGRPIYNPTIGMVSTHYDIFMENYKQRQFNQQRTERMMRELDDVRQEADAVLQNLWDQIEAHYAAEPPEVRYKKCRELGVIYYYRRHEPHIY